MAMHPDLSEAIDAALSSQSNQTDEFRKRFRRLIDNVVTAGKVSDSDVQGVIELAAVQSELEL